MRLLGKTAAMLLALVLIPAGYLYELIKSLIDDFCKGFMETVHSIDLFFGFKETECDVRDPNEIR